MPQSHLPEFAAPRAVADRSRNAPAFGTRIDATGWVRRASGRRSDAAAASGSLAEWTTTRSASEPGSPMDVGRTSPNVPLGRVDLSVARRRRDRCRSLAPSIQASQYVHVGTTLARPAIQVPEIAESAPSE